MKSYAWENKVLVKLVSMISALAAVVCLGLFTGCTGGAAGGDITVVSRESGSGTRGAFVELFEVEETIDGKTVDATTETADITNSTEVVITAVEGNPSAIGYISLGSLNDSVKALRIDGAEATVDNIKSGTYKISRPFNIVTKDGNVSEAAADFIRYILSADGQAVIEENGYISAVSNPPYICNNEKKDMSRNVLDHEPHSALFVPDDEPLLFYRAITCYAASALRPGGSLYFELNPLYADLTADMARQEGFTQVSVIDDMYGKRRMMKATKK